MGPDLDPKLFDSLVFLKAFFKRLILKKSADNNKKKTRGKELSYYTLQKGYNKGPDQTVLMHRLVCAFVNCMQQHQFSPFEAHII